MSRNNSNEVTIIMVETKQGSPDGLTVKNYEKGGTYTLPSSLASVFLKQKWAKLHKRKAQEDEPSIDPGLATGFALLPEGALTCAELAEDKLNNDQLVAYAKKFLGTEKAIYPTAPHDVLLQQVINLQKRVEEELVAGEYNLDEDH